MDWLINNWYLIVAGIAIIVGLVLAVKKFIKLPTNEQLKSIKKWLLWAVSVAENELGSGTGQLKLVMVYDMFLSKFPWISKIIGFATFSKFVDGALDEMRELLEKNQAINEVIVGENKEVK
jgi:hypothetical protein